MLKVLRASLNISDEIHHKFEAEIKAELMQDQTPNPSENIMGNDLHYMIQEPVQEPPPSTPSISESIKNVKIKKFLTLGKEKCRTKDYDSALKFLTHAQELSPDDDELKFLIKKINHKIQIAKKEDNGSDEPKSTNFEIPVADKSIQTNPMSIPTESNPTDQSQPKAAIPINESNATTETIQSAPAAIPVSKSGVIEASKDKQDKGLGLLDDEAQCISCEGTGKCYWCNGSSKCDRCGGTGSFNDETCTICEGSGNCNSCSATGQCPWCKGTGTRVLRMGTPIS
jgi:hypothetical protein